MWHKESGQSKKLANKREVRVCSDCTGKREMNVLKWFWYVERMKEAILAKRVYRASVEGNRGRGRPQRKGNGEFKELLMERGLSEREVMVLARDKEALERMVYGSE